MKVSELAKRIDQRATYRVGNILFDVTIVEVKVSYGKTRYFIKPTHGDGGAWVDEDSLRFDAGGKQ